MVSSDQPFPVEVMVFEEDTYRVLSAGNFIREIRQPLEELEAQAVHQQASRTGDLVIRGSRWFAVVHDFDRPDPYDSKAVSAVLEALSSRVAEQQITALAIQPLGAWHGPDQMDTAVQRIRRLAWPDCLRHVWVVSR